MLRSLSIAVLAPLIIAAPRPDPAGMTAVLSLMGITPNSLAVGGLGVEEAGVFLDTIETSEGLRHVLDAASDAGVAEAALAQVAANVDPLDVDGATAIAAAEQRVTDAKQRLRDEVEGLWARAVRDLSPSQRYRISAWRTGPGGLPPEFRAVTWSASMARDLVSALREERAALDADEPVPLLAVSVLADARARPEVADASQRMIQDAPALTLVIASKTR
jgi:hypothetical protein